MPPSTTSSSPFLYMNTYIHTDTHTYIHACIHTYIHTYIQATSTVIFHVKSCANGGAVPLNHRTDMTGLIAYRPGDTTPVFVDGTDMYVYALYTYIYIYIYIYICVGF